jgi:putative proteasome-type protease
MKLALKAGFLSFDSTRISAADVDFPIDVALYKSGTYNLVEYHYEKSDLESVSAQWHEELKNALNNTSNQWIENAFNQLENTPTAAHEV